MKTKTMGTLLAVSIVQKTAVIIFLAVLVAIYYIELRIIVTAVICRIRGGGARRVMFNKKTLLVHALAAAGIGCFVYGLYIEPYRLEVNRFHITTSKLSRASFTLVHITDMHCDRHIVNEKKIIKLIDDIKPDVIVFTGDALNTETALPVFEQTMGLLNAPLGKFAVLGNVDAYRFNGLDILGRTGFSLLNMNSRLIRKDGEAINITGISCGYERSMPGVIGQNSPEVFNVLLYHLPDIIEDIDNKKVDLYLAGHTHGGQIALPYYGALLTFSKFGKKYESGMHHVGGTILYVNRGIGMEGDPAPRARFCASPEIAVFYIEPGRVGQKE